MTEAKRDNKSKPALSMLPLAFEGPVARVMMFGATKYGRDNYLTGHRVTGLIDSIKRHTAAIMEGEDLDPESGQPHWAHIAANCLMALHQTQLGTIKDDRYKPPQGKPSPEIGDAFVSMPVTVWEIQAQGRRGPPVTAITLLTKPTAADLEAVAREWPGFTLSVKEVTDDFGHKATA